MFTGLPIKAILSHWGKADVPGHVSNTAGTYLCNQLFYLACVEGRARDIPAGFIHVPDTPQSAAAGSAGVRATMEISTMERGIRIAITASAAGEADVRMSAGAVA